MSDMSILYWSNIIICDLSIDRTTRSLLTENRYHLSSISSTCVVLITNKFRVYLNKWTKGYNLSKRTLPALAVTSPRGADTVFWGKIGTLSCIPCPQQPPRATDDTATIPVNFQGWISVGSHNEHDLKYISTDTDMSHRKYGPSMRSPLAYIGVLHVHFTHIQRRWYSCIGLLPL